MVDRDDALTTRMKRELMGTKFNLFFIVALLIVLACLGILKWSVIPFGAKIILLIICTLAAVSFSAASLLTRINNEAEVRYGALVNRIPALGTLARQIAENHFTRSFTGLYGAGVLPGRALSLAAAACGSPTMCRSLITAVPKVRNGVSLAECLEETGCISEYLVSMLRVGEEAGKLTDVLKNAQQYQEGQIAASMDELKTVIGTLTNLTILALGGEVAILFYTVLL